MRGPVLIEPGLTRIQRVGFSGDLADENLGPTWKLTWEEGSQGLYETLRDYLV